jgi:hypothetical protein
MPDAAMLREKAEKPSAVESSRPGSTLATDRPIYHDDARCGEGDAIGLTHRRADTSGRAHCAQHARQEPPAPTRLMPPMSSRRPAPPETAERRCPACQSDRVTPAEHVIVSGGVVVRKEYRCAACGAVLWVRADGEVNAPRA